MVILSRRPSQKHSRNDKMLQKLYQWNPSEHAIIEDTWGKVVSTLYTRECIVDEKVPDLFLFLRMYEIAGRHIGPLRSGLTNLVSPLRTDAVRLMRHKRKDDSFVDTKSKSINDEMEARVTAAISSSSDDSQAVQELDVNRIYLDVMGGEKK
ncbi:hypothetical protein K7X08_034840 [Anisodus acutangulus]|uniref:Uncharacterized protein n=1 Tax=Anisodus acutangulus TaxID=402998 RepID=A0A9Q1LGG2_9SOLA|nr:hypothetical protein K7X08_034840 [Anisodus acutangulus]